MAVTPNGHQVDKPYVTTYTYDINNRLLREEKREDGATETLHYTYDANGGQTRREWARVEDKQPTGRKGEIGFVTGAESRGAVTLDLRAYNGFGQLIEVSRDMVRTVYTYRPDGLRHQKTVTQTLHNKTTTTLHHWDGQNMVMETNGQTGRTKARYLRGAGLITQVIDLSLAFYLFNAHGDVTQRVDAAGNTLAKYDYDAFGNRRWQPDADTHATDGLETDPNPFRYCGEYYDSSSGEYYLRARMYNPRTGRFTSEDAVKFVSIVSITQQECVDPLSLNLYTYAQNDPIQYYDPSGNAILAIALGILAVSLISGGFDALSAHAKGEDIGAAFVGGFLETAVTAAATAVLGPGAGAAVNVVATGTNSTYQGIRNGKSPEDIAKGVVVDMATGAISYGISGVVGYGITNVAGGDNLVEGMLNGFYEMGSGAIEMGIDFAFNPPNRQQQGRNTAPTVASQPANQPPAVTPSTPTPRPSAGAGYTPPITPSTPAPSSSGGYVWYTVKAGESPWSIAAKVLGDGRRYQEIQALTRWGGVDPGQRLRIPV